MLAATLSAAQREFVTHLPAVESAARWVFGHRLHLRRQDFEEALAETGADSRSPRRSMRRSSDDTDAGDDHSARVWEWDHPDAPQAVLRGRNAEIHEVTTRPDGRWLVTVSQTIG